MIRFIKRFIENSKYADPLERRIFFTLEIFYIVLILVCLGRAICLFLK